MARWLEPLPVFVFLLLAPLGFLFAGSGRPGLGVVVPGAIWAGAVGIFLAVVVHELGHLLAGLAVRMEVRTFVAGPLSVRRTSTGVGFEVNRHWRPLGFVALDVGRQDDLRRRLGWMIAGGPLANLVVAAVGIALLLAAHDAVDRATLRGFLRQPLGMVSVLLATQFVFQSLVVGLVNAVPMREAGFLSDGARLRMLWRGGEAAERWCAVWSLRAAYTAGEPPRSWSPELVQRLLLPADGSVDELGGLGMAYLHALDRGEHGPAGEHLDRMVAVAEGKPALRSAIAPDVAFFLAHVRGDAAAARGWLAEARGSFVPEHARLEAEAAVLLAEGQPDAALERIREAREAVARLPASQVGTIQSANEWLGRLEERARGPVRAPVTA